MEVKELLNKNLADVAKSNPSGEMWFFQDPELKGWHLDDEERDGNFSYWHLYSNDGEHAGTISVEDGVITQLPRNLSENNLSEELKRMRKLAGFLKENEDQDYENYIRNLNTDWGDIAIDRREEIVKKIESEFGPQNRYSGSADWGGIPVWSVLGSNFEGYFIIDDSEFQNDMAFSLMKRTFNEEKEESEDEMIFTAFVTPERYGDKGDGTIDELLAKAREIKNTGELSENNQADPEYIKMQIQRAHGEEPTAEEMATIMAAMQKKEGMIKEGELGKAIAKILKEELFKK